MIAVIFEVTPDPAESQRYFDLAASLREQLEKIDGFISIERYQSLADENKYLSLSFWRDREAVEAWYRLPSHRDAQEEGRQNIFLDYRIRVAEVFRDYDMAHGRPGGVQGAGPVEPRQKKPGFKARRVKQGGVQGRGV